MDAETNDQLTPLRVLVVTPRYAPLAGGVENHVRELARRMPGDIELTVLTTDTSGTLPAEETIDTTRVIRVRAYPKGRDYRVAPSLSRVIARGGWDLVHVQSYHTAVAPLAMLAARRARIPYVVSLHGGGHSSPLRTALRGLQQRALAPLLAGAERIVSVAEFEAAHFSAKLGIPRERFTVIPNGSDLPLPPGAEMVAPSASPRIIASVGRLEQYKGHHRVVAAMPAVLREEPDTELHVVGSGPYEGAIRDLAERLGIADRVHIRSIPAENRSEMATELLSATAIVLMSEFETHPLAVMEALALGRPALVANTSGLREIAECGLARAIALDSSTEAIAAAVVEMMRMPPAVPEIALPTWDQCAAGVVAVYRDAVASRAHRAGDATAPRSKRA